MKTVCVNMIQNKFGKVSCVLDEVRK